MCQIVTLHVTIFNLEPETMTKPKLATQWLVYPIQGAYLMPWALKCRLKAWAIRRNAASPKLKLKAFPELLEESGRIWKNLEEETPLQACHADTSTLTSILYKGVQFQTVQWPPVFFFLIPVACLQPFRRKRMAVFGPFKHMRGVGCYLLGLSFNRKGCMGPIQAE